MSATIWFIIAIVGFSLAGILLIGAVFMFIKLNIPAIIGDLTGRTAAKQIEEIRKMNAASGDKQHKSNAFNIERGSLTESVFNITRGKSRSLGNTAQQKAAHPSKRLDVKDDTKEILEILNDVNVTDVLSDPEPTEVLSEFTDVLTQESEMLSEGTQVLTEDNATTVLRLDSDENSQQSPKPIEFKMVKNVVIVNTDEVIS